MKFFIGSKQVNENEYLRFKIACLKDDLKVLKHNSKLIRNRYVNEKIEQLNKTARIKILYQLTKREVKKCMIIIKLKK
jgi:hypothetical protein